GGDRLVNHSRTMGGGWVRDRKIKIILEAALERHPDLAGVPTMVELGKTAEDRETIAFFAGAATIGRSIVAPPDLPEEELAVLRAAFEATMKDPQFLAEAKQSNIDIDPLAGEDVAKISERIVGVGPIERARVRNMPTR